MPDAGLMLAIIARKAGDTNEMEHWSGVALDYYYNRVTKAIFVVIIGVVSVVPEPSVVGLLSMGGAAAFGFLRRKK